MSTVRIEKNIGRPLLLPLSALLLVVGACAHQAVQQQTIEEEETPSRQPYIEPKAIDILKASSNRLASAHTMKFTAVVSYEGPSLLGPPLIYTIKSDVTLERPDKLKVVTP